MVRLRTMIHFRKQNKTIKFKCSRCGAKYEGSGIVLSGESDYPGIEVEDRIFFSRDCVTCGSEIILDNIQLKP